jgi:hypothetical protein
MDYLILGSLITFVLMMHNEKPIYEYLQDLKTEFMNTKEDINEYKYISYME